MDMCDAVRMMVSLSGMSHREIAARLGKSDAYVSVMVGSVCSGRDVGIRKLAAIADACGYDLSLVDRETGRGITLG